MGKYGSDTLEEDFANMLAGKSEEELEALAYNSPAVHFCCYTSILDKDNRALNPTPNILQLRMSEVVETMKDLGIRVRVIAVKPRRAGCSTFANHVIYHEGMKRPIEAITISDIAKHSEELIEKTKAYEKGDTFPWGNHRVQNAQKSMAWENGTKWTVDTAENSDAGVGGTRQGGHFSEVSKWPQTNVKNDKKTMASVLPSLSGMDTIVIAESTPEGARGWLHKTWHEEAIWLHELMEMIEQGIRPEKVWIKVFAAWFEFADNCKETPCSEREIEILKRSLTPHEKDEIEKYNLSWEQIAWRRETIASDCGGDPKFFSFYYPSDDVTCWLASGSPRFDLGVITEMESHAKSVVPEYGYLNKQDTGTITWHPTHDGSGEIWIWEQPLYGLRYLVTLDPAEDISQTIGEDPDAHSLSVWRAGYFDELGDVWKPARKVARVKPPFRADGDIVAGHASRLSHYYGNCIIVMEVNIGKDILRLLKEAGHHLYKRRPESHRTGETTEQYGFRLNSKEDRNLIIQGFATAIREREIDVSCSHSLNEYKMFVVKPNGRAEAAAGAHDDDVAADAMAWECMPSATEFKKIKRKHPDPPDRKNWRTINAVRRGY